jgi:hypothetical protein
MKIKTIRVKSFDTLIVKNELEYQFAKLNFNENVKIIRENTNDRSRNS